MRATTADSTGERKGSSGVILTIGHSNLPLDTFVSRIAAHGVRRLVDVRRFPSSRRFPHFNAKPLAHALDELGITYRHMADLGGRREPVPGSRHVAIAEPMLRSYADHMATSEFRTALRELLELARAQRTALMCAEADPKHCHRRLLSDALVLRGVDIRHVRDEVSTFAHTLPSYLRTEGDTLVYDGGALTIDFGDGHLA